MSRTRAFTLIELLVVISIIALLIGILLPALGAAQRAARQTQNSTQIRGVHTGMTIYAQGNNGFFPGQNGTKETPTDQVTPSGAAVQTGMHVQARYRVLLDNRYFTGEYVNAPTDDRIPWTDGNVLLEHYSYAMLAMCDRGSGFAQRNVLPPNLNSENATEWGETTNSEAVVLSDRAIANGSSAMLRSIHTEPKPGTNDWRGSVGWNDGHVTFENTRVVKTRHGNTINDRDDLFTGNQSEAEALMIYHYVGKGSNAPSVYLPYATSVSSADVWAEP